MIDLRYPVCWEEITPQQLKVIAKGISKNFSKELLLTWCFLKFSKIKIHHQRFYQSGRELYFLAHRGKEKFNISATVIQTACADLHYIVDEVGLLSFSPIRGINHKLYNVPFEDYYSCDALIYQYQLTGQKRYLQKAIKILSKKYVFLTAARRTEIVLWWNGVRSYLQMKYPSVLSSGSSSSASYSPADTLIDILEGLNESRPQDNNAILSSDTHFVLSSLNNKIERLNAQKLPQ